MNQTPNSTRFNFPNKTLRLQTRMRTKTRTNNETNMIERTREEKKMKTLLIPSEKVTNSEDTDSIDTNENKKLNKIHD